MAGEPVIPWEHPGHQRVKRWRTGHIEGWRAQQVILGYLPDGRWYVEHAGRPWQCRAYPRRDIAEAVAFAVMGKVGGEWSEVPANGGI